MTSKNGIIKSSQKRLHSNHVAILFLPLLLFAAFTDNGGKQAPNVLSKNGGWIMTNKKVNCLTRTQKDTVELKIAPNEKREPFVLRLSQKDKVTTILDSTKSVQMKSGFVTLKQGEDVGSHNTGEHEELLVILDGKGEIHAQGLGEKAIEKGMVVYVPPNNQHDVYCTGPVPLKYIYIVAPVK
jgi:mannose-6-phosphate isomerase-like protein (cupin superfamily)